MKILCLVLLVGVFAIESEAWGPRIRLPRIRVPRIPTPRIRLPRIRIRVPKPNIGKIWDKASNAFKSIYKTVCGDQKKRDCGYSLITRVQGVCNGQSCLKQNFKFGKRSIDPKSKTFNERKYFCCRRQHPILNMKYRVYLCPVSLPELCIVEISIGPLHF
jgi:hypothetical protein